MRQTKGRQALDGGRLPEAEGRGDAGRWEGSSGATHRTRCIQRRGTVVVVDDDRQGTSIRLGPRRRR